MLYSRCAPIAVLVCDGFYSTSSSYPNKASEASNIYPNDRHFCSFLLQIDTAWNEVCTGFTLQDTWIFSRQNASKDPVDYSPAENSRNFMEMT